MSRNLSYLHISVVALVLHGTDHPCSQKGYSTERNQYANSIFYYWIFLFLDKEVLKPDRKSLNKDYAKKNGQGGFMAQRIPAFLRSKKLKKRTRPGTSCLCSLSYFIFREESVCMLFDFNWEIME